MKRIIALLLSVLLIATMLIGCNGGAAETGSTEQDTSTTESNEAEDTDTTENVASGDVVTLSLLSWNTEAVMGGYIEAFEAEHPNIRIDFQFVPPVQQYIERFNVLVASGQMPDMFYTAAENMTDIVERGLAVDISDMEVFSRIDPHTAATWGYDGAIYGFAPDAWIAGIMYNEEIFRDAGIDGPPTTWAEFIEICEVLQDFGVIPYLDQADHVHNIPQNLYQSMMISVDPTIDSRINNGEATFVEYYTEPFTIWYEDMVAAGLYNQMALGLNHDQLINMFVNGEVAMIHSGPWNVSTIEEMNPELEYSVFGLPAPNGANIMTGAVNVGLSISSSSPYQEEARLFLEFMTRDENVLEWHELTGNMIIIEGIDYTVDSVFGVFREDAVEGNFYLPQIVWRYSAAIYRELLIGIQDVLTGADSIENVPVRLDELQDELSR